MPSSRYTIAAAVRKLPANARFVVEYGAGDGVFTKELLRALPSDGKLLAIEINQEFLPKLFAIKDNRLSVYHGDIRDALECLGEFGISRVDAIVSGIPFTFLSSRGRRDIILKTHGVLKEGGRFIAYQTSPLLVPYLKAFKKVDIQFEPRNFPPYFVMTAIKA